MVVIVLTVARRSPPSFRWWDECAFDLTFRCLHDEIRFSLKARGS